MNATLEDYFEEFELTTNAKPPASSPQPKSTTLAQTPRFLAQMPRHERTDISLWLAKNAPFNVQELQDVRYTLYHRCSRAEFKVSQKQDKNIFVLSGLDSSLKIVSNKARRYLLWRLRILAREQEWVGRSRIRIPFG
jgi:hypothetical protein